MATFKECAQRRQLGLLRQTGGERRRVRFDVQARRRTAWGEVCLLHMASVPQPLGGQLVPRTLAPEGAATYATRTYAGTTYAGSSVQPVVR
jgi:hypothetical protein